MNYLDDEKVGALIEAFMDELGIRAAARKVCVDKKTAARYYKIWQDELRQMELEAGQK